MASTVAVADVQNKMTAALKAEVQKLRLLQVKMDKNEIESRYQFGLVLKTVAEDKDTYGNSALEQIALAMGFKLRALQYAMHVANAFTKEDIENFLKLRDTEGRTFSWSHIRHLASVEKKGDRNKLIKAWERECLTVEDFTARIQSLTEARDLGEEPPAAEIGGASLAITPAKLKQVTSRLKQLEEVFKELGQADLRVTLADEKKKELIEELISELNELESQKVALLARIEEVSQELRQEEPLALAEGEEEPAEVGDLLEGLVGDADTSATAVLQNAMHRKSATKATKGKSDQKAKAAAKKPTTGPKARRRRG